MTPRLSILHIAHSDSGGASLSAQRLHQHLLANGINSQIAYKWKTKASTPGFQLIHKYPLIISWIREKLAALPFFILRPIQYHSLAISTDIKLSSILTGVDLVHLHWPHGCTIAVKDYPSIHLPLVVTLHDCWHFSGAEHHFDPSSHTTPLDGYSHSPCLLSPTKLFLYLINKSAYKRKAAILKGITPHFLAPSLWIYDLATRSRLLRNQTITYCPNIIPKLSTSNSHAAVRELFIHNDRPILLAPIASLSDRNRPYLRAIYEILSMAAACSCSFNLLVLCSDNTTLSSTHEVDVIQIDQRRSQQSIFDYLHSSDLLLYPSLSDNLPQLCQEATGCGLPVVGFNTGGVPETIPSANHGNLVSPGDFSSLAERTITLLKSPQKLASQSREALNYSNPNYDIELITARILSVYSAHISGATHLD